MKPIYQLFCIMLLSFLTACFDDKGNYDYRPGSVVTVSGINATETALAGEKKKIVTTVEETNPSENKYLWLLSSTTTFLTRDTLSREKDLDVLIAKPIGFYYAMFQVIDAETEVVKFYHKFNLNVTSERGKGWILLTDEGGNSDVTMVVTVKEQAEVKRNLIREVTGTSMNGVALSFLFIPNHNYYKQIGNQLVNQREDVVGITTANDLKIYSADSYVPLRGFSDVFADGFKNVSPDHPVLVPESYSIDLVDNTPGFGLINGRRLYFFDGKNDLTGQMTSELNSEIRSVSSLMVAPKAVDAIYGYNPDTRSIFGIFSNARTVYPPSDERLKECDLIKMGTSPVFHGANRFPVLLKDPATQEYHFYIVGKKGNSMSDGVPLLIDEDLYSEKPLKSEIAEHIKATTCLVLADKRAVNNKFVFIENECLYHAGSQIYSLTRDGGGNFVETPKYTFNGEEITAMSYFSHQDGLVHDCHKLAVATWNGSSGKLYVFNVAGTSTDLELKDTYSNVGYVKQIRLRDVALKFARMMAQ